MLDFLRRCVGYLTGGYQQQPEEFELAVHIWSADDRCIDFLVGGDEIISVLRNQVRESPLAQKYALHGTVVVDIRQKPDREKMFKSAFPEFDVELNTGVIYSVGPNMGPVHTVDL